MLLVHVIHAGYSFAMPCVSLGPKRPWLFVVTWSERGALLAASAELSLRAGSSYSFKKRNIKAQYTPQKSEQKLRAYKAYSSVLTWSIWSDEVCCVYA